MVRTPGLYPGYGARLAHSVGSSPARGTKTFNLKGIYEKDSIRCTTGFLYSYSSRK